MSNSIIPHLLSDSPPPISGNIVEDYDDEFGDFTGPGDLSFDNDNTSTSSTPKNSSQKSPTLERKFSSCQLSSEDESVVNKIEEELPSKNFINILDHIENNVQKLENINLKKLENINFKNDVILSPDISDCIEKHDFDKTLEPHLDPEKEVSECNGIIHSFKNENHVSQEVLGYDSDERISKLLGKEELLINDHQVEMPEELSSNVDHKGKDYNENSINKLGLNLDDTEISENIKIPEVNEEIEISTPTAKLQLYNNDWSFEDSNDEKITETKVLDILCQFNGPDESQESSSQLDTSQTSQYNGSDAPNSSHAEDIANEPDTDDFDEFADFTSFQNPAADLNLQHFPNIDAQEPIQNIDSEDIDEFADFANHSSFNQMENDDFDDFSSYSTFTNHEAQEKREEPGCQNPKDALEKSKILLEKIFPHQKLDLDDYLQYDFTTENSVFQQLKDVTETNAVSYQWEKSTARKNLLKTLNIDIRNILYGPSWNVGVPIFAANLSSAPLEPIRTDLPPQTPPIKENQTPPESSSNVVPMAEFDWNSSGLTNPLSSFKNANTDTLNDVTEGSPVKEVDDVTNPVIADDLPEECAEEEKENDNRIEADFSDFASYRPKTEPETEWSRSILPLRESHISIQSLNNSGGNSKVEFIENQPYYNLDLDLLETKNANQPSNPLGDFKDLEFFELDENALDLNRRQSTSPDNTKDSDEVSLPQSDSAGSFDIPDPVVETEDEFSDFHSSMPPRTEVTEQPLQPAVLQPIPVNYQPITKIEWPDPGLDEDEVNRIVMGCLTKTTNVDKPVEKQESKSDNNDEDEWTDFVSVKNSVKSRTSTPDLPLSVFNLGNIQPVKAPTPLITPNGLVCSPVKTVSPDTKSKHTNNYHQHPFITSQAFEALNYASFSASSQQNKYGINQYENYQSSNSNALRNNADDDDWGEFVSATNVPLPANNLNPVQSSKHIFTNPSLNMVALNKKAQQYSFNSKSTVVRQEKRNIPTISALPDLDFVSPKTRSIRK